MAWAIIIPLLAVTGILVWASTSIASRVYVKALCRVRTDKKVVALTFDDGPNPEYTPRVLDVLASKGVKATFFIVGERAEAYPDIVQRIVAEGHIVGNHTYSHNGNFPIKSRRKMEEELKRCDDVLEKITSKRSTLFRPPFGVTNPPTARAVRNGGYTVVGWDVRSLDTVSRWPRTKVFERVCRRVRSGSVVLLHDDREGGDALVEMILNHLEQSGYEVARLDKLFEL
jgi:peptidoglycan/xylan/chitin deacetylase (PgdA/CDA1 family)